jgi:hypothetical protein
MEENGWGRQTTRRFFPVAEERLRVALGSEVALTWEKEAGRTFYLHLGSNYSDPNALS